MRCVHYDNNNVVVRFSFCVVVPQ